ncbi:ZP domain-containing protein [Trichonephila inaurata madagascariensis]|uniref:ZP domain-containing protein n=1 Tax=Trichonephila inaurata madagascariensis TaxID=2747483 RepID=A0A8X7BUX3_9ARAC|nr:ZP domain-containing protein [Trichonephila inaurata madagascariensis]
MFRDSGQSTSEQQEELFRMTYDVTCSAALMKVTIMVGNNHSNVFIENLRGFDECLPKTVEGKAVLKLPLDNFHKCGTTRMTNKFSGQTVYYNRIIIEEPKKPRELLLVKCVLPVDKTKTADWEKKRPKRNLLPPGFVEAEDLNITNIVAHAPTPYLNLAVRQNGRVLDTAYNVQPGTPLEMVVYLDSKSASTYGILVSYLKVTDGTPEHDEIIVMNGCSIDPYIFGNFETPDEGKTLYSKFRAFKFPDSNYVLFVGTVNVCLKQCRGVKGDEKNSSKQTIQPANSRNTKVYRLSFPLSLGTEMGNHSDSPTCSAKEGNGPKREIEKGTTSQLQKT